MTRIYETWLKRFESGGVTYGEMRQLVTVVGGWVLAGYPRGHRTAMTEDEALDLWRRLDGMRRTPPPAGLDLIGTASQASPVLEDGQWRHPTWKEFGRNWVARNGRRAGLPGDLVAAAAELDFRLVGIERFGNNYAPIYRAFVIETGEAWTYAPLPWQVKVF